MKTAWLAGIALLISGCGSEVTREAAPAAPLNAGFVELSAEDALKLTTYGLMRAPGAVLVWEEVSAKQKLQETDIPFVKSGKYSGEIGYLRNPGVRFAILLRKPDGSSITQGEVIRIEREAAELGLKTSSEIKLLPKLGPDGKTPLALPDRFMSEESASPTTLTSVIAFKTEADAKAAKDYIGVGYRTNIRFEKPKPLTVNGKVVVPPAADNPWMLEISCEGPPEAANSEMDEFERIAAATNGLFVTTYHGISPPDAKPKQA